jgi:hypothetical protein
MTRRGAQLPWGGGRGIYDNRGGPGLGQMAALAAIAVAVVGIAFFIFTRACGGQDCKTEYCPSGRSIQAPDGYELVSKIFEYDKKRGPVPPGTDVGVLFPLMKVTNDGRNLSFYRYVEETKAWEVVAPAVLDPQGKQVTGSLKDAPTIMAVMRRLSAAGNVVAYLEHNANLHREAVGRVTIIHTFDFKPNPEGLVQGDVSAVKLEGVAWYPTILASTADKTNIAAESILQNATGRSNHVQQIMKKIADAKLAGIDIAYLDLRADQRASFSLFVGELGQQLHAQGKVLTLTLPCPLKAQDRVDEGAYDWQELGKIGDVLQMAPCRDQSTFRKDMPDILQHLIAVVPASKLVMIVTPYATEKTPDGIRRLSVTEAMSIATKLSIQTNPGEKLTTNTNVNVVGVNIDKSENLTGVLWDVSTACVAFTYKSGAPRTVWIENVFSVGFKLEFISRFQLGGVGVEDASDNVYLGNIWPALLPFIASGQPALVQPNANDLAPRWKASKGTIDEGARGRGVVRWQTPAEPGTYTINLTLSDGVALFESEIAAAVQQRDQRTPGPGTPPAGQTPVG